MAFTPSSPLNIVYKKYLPSPSINVVLDLPYDAEMENNFHLPYWLEMVNYFQSGNNQTGPEYYFTLRLKTGVADGMAAGNYSTSIDFYGYRTPIDQEDRAIIVDTYTVNLEVKENTLLTLTPDIMAFSHQVGAAAPSTKLMQIASETNWNVSADSGWITLSAITGVNSSSIDVGVDPSGLVPGVYTAIVSVQDSNYTKQLTVYLSVNEGDTTIDYLYLNPNNFEFISEFSKPNINTKKLNIDVSAAWSANISESWLLLSETSGVAGIEDVLVSVDSAALAIGVYTASITVSSQDLLKTIYVTLRIIDTYNEGIEDGGLYYAKDRNTLVVSAINDNTFLTLDLTTSNSSENYQYEKKQPYFRGISKSVIGLETSKLLLSVVPTSNFSTRVYNSIQPLTMNIAAYDKDRFTGGISPVANFQNLRFLKGKTPAVTGRLSYIPNKITVSNKAKVNLSIVSELAPANPTISGAISATIFTSISSGLFVYSVILNLSDYTLVQDDAIKLSFGDQTLDIIINNNATALHTIAFENEWGEYELFETRGKISRTNTVDKTYQEKAVNGDLYTSVLEARPSAEFNLNTGFINTQEEVDWFSEILNARRIFIYEGTTPVEIILVNERLKVSKTREHIKEYSLNFKKAVK